MKNNYQKYFKLKKKIILLGFGSIGQAILPLLFRHIELSPAQIIIISKNNEGEKIAQEMNIPLQIITITENNYKEILKPHLDEGNFLLNLSTGIASIDLINLCQAQKMLYLDASTEPWEGLYVDPELSASSRSNYALREAVLALKGKGKSTALITHGANPGWISHFVKQALRNIAKDNDLMIEEPKAPTEWAALAHTLGIKAIHISERDTQVTNQTKRANEFVNTWSVPGFMSEAAQPAELGWGTHERHWPNDARHHSFGCKCAIYLDRPGACTKVRTWTPSFGTFHGFLITHAESLSISNYLTLMNDKEVIYRPTVHYAYFPCPDATLSLHEFAGNELSNLNGNRLIINEITEGVDELGVLLMGNKKGAYWYGSQLSIEEARKQVSNNNATSLQVAAGVLGGVIWAFQNQNEGIVEPEDIDYQYVMNIAMPYLGKVAGYYTDWTPLKNREQLFSEIVDESDPWQFLNIRVS
jgi:homospermidine synthase